MGYPMDDHLDGADHLEEAANRQQERSIFDGSTERGTYISRLRWWPMLFLLGPICLRSNKIVSSDEPRDESFAISQRTCKVYADYHEY